MCEKESKQSQDPKNPTAPRDSEIPESAADQCR